MTQRNSISLARLDGAVQAYEALLAFIRPIMIDSRITAAEFSTYMELRHKLDLHMIPIAAFCDTQKKLLDVVVTSPESSV